MVKKGEYLERPALIEVDGIWLEGLYHRGEDKPGLLVCPPIAGEIGMDTPPVAELAFATARAGRASLRFQHRGFGASQGASDPTRSIDDARGALAHLIACTTSARIDVAGYRSGALTAVQLARTEPRVRSIVLVAPQTMLDLVELENRRVLVVLGSLTEEPLLEAWRARVDVLPEGALAIIDEADYRFVRGLTTMGDKVVRWLESSTDLFAGLASEAEAVRPTAEEQVGDGDDAMIIER